MTETTKLTPSMEEVQKSLGMEGRAASYRDRVRQSDAVKTRNVPLGGAPPLETAKMQQLREKNLPQPFFSSDDKDTFDPPPVFPSREKKSEPPITGIGSAYAANQAVSSGMLDRPQSLRKAADVYKERKMQQQQETKQLSSESQKALEMAQFDLEEQQAPQEQEAVLGDEHNLEGVERGFVDRGYDLPSVDFDGIRSYRNTLISKERRALIEKRLEKLQLSDMITQRELQQTVPVRPGQFEVTLRTFSQKEHLWILSYLYEFTGSSGYADELLNTFKLVLSLVAVNGARLPDHRENVGTSKENVNRDAFIKKMDHVTAFPVQIIADMGVQTTWFNDRVNKLLDYDSLKNG